MRRVLWLVLCALTLTAAVLWWHAAPVTDTVYVNRNTGAEPAGLWEIAWGFARAERVQPKPPQPLPLEAIDPAALRDIPPERPLIWRLGHSSLLLHLDGEFILVDPMFSRRASPVSWAGPARFHPPPIAVRDLPPIRAVVFSHDHYDHLDISTVKRLHDLTEVFVTPLGVGERLRRWGIDSAKVVELDWWERTSLGRIELTATPAQHFSGRGLRDRDTTLWAGWAIASPQARVFYSGDTGYFDGFKEIGERLGPFDLACIENGAYSPMWPAVHLTPEQGVQAHLDLGAAVMLPVHNSTFDLALHDWDDPLERALTAAEHHGVALATPRLGAPMVIGGALPDERWWRALAP